MKKPVIGIIGGTGLADALTAQTAGRRVEMDTPYGQPSSPIIITEWNGLEIALLSRHGEGHVHPPSAVPYRANLFALKQLGVTHILASGAVGSLCEQMAPRELVIVDQVIDKTFRRASTFFESGIAVHTELSSPFCPVLRERLLALRSTVGVRVHDGGTYVCMEGPQFSSRAESHMHQGWGGHLIGMTCLPEAKLAREAEIAYALVALVTDYDSWRPNAPGLDQAALLAEIISHLHDATANAIALIRATVESLSEVPPGPSPAHDALRLAIWSDKSRVAPALVERLRPILGRYFNE